MTHKKTPRPHQTAAVKAVVKGFRSHNRGKLIMACGTGKTLIAGWVRDALKSGLTLFMAPSNALLAQTLKAWREVSREPFEALAVCSDKTVAGDEEDLRASDIGTTVTTDYQSIAEFICSSGPRVVFCTYQSSEALALAMGLVHVPAFDLAVADEAHRTTGQVDHCFPTIVHPDKIRATKKLFMTATPRFYFENLETELASMDNEELYGPVFHELDFAEAIQLELLTDYEILVVGVSPEATAEAEELLKKNPYLKVGDRNMAAKDLAVHIAIMKTIKERKLSRVITFHGSCARATATAHFLPQLQAWMPEKYRTAVPVWASTVNYSMDISDRQVRLQEFVDLEGPGVITNSHCLGEGVDVPAVDGIAFMDAKKSKIEIAQAVGRAIRLSPGKKKSFVILPVIMLPGDDPEQISNKSFKPAFGVINALRAHDSTLMDQLQSWNAGSHRGNSTGSSYEGDGARKIEFDIPADCDPRIADWFVTRAHTNGDAAWGAMNERVTHKLRRRESLDAAERAWALGQRALLQRRQRSVSRYRRDGVRKWIEAFNVLYPVRSTRSEALARVLKACETTGHQPISSDADAWVVKTENLAAGWSEENKAAQRIILSYPTFQAYRDRKRAGEMADRVDAIVRETGCRPTQCDPDQTKVVSWLYNARQNPSVRLYGVRTVEWLHAIMRLKPRRVRPGQRLANHDFAVVLDALIAFIAENRVFPSARVKEKNTAEFRLRRRYNRLAHAYPHEPLVQKMRDLHLKHQPTRKTP